MSLCSRIGDIGYGTCPGDGGGSHSTTGTIVAGASISLVEGSPMARINDMIISDCSHSKIGLIIGGSGTVFVEGLPAARVGDAFDGTFSNGTLTSGSGTVIIGG